MAHISQTLFKTKGAFGGADWSNWGSLLFLRAPAADQSLWEEWLGHGIVTILTKIINLENYFNLKNHLSMAKNVLQKAKQRSISIDQTLSPTPIMLCFPFHLKSSHSQFYHSLLYRQGRVWRKKGPQADPSS